MTKIRILGDNVKENGEQFKKSESDIKLINLFGIGKMKKKINLFIISYLMGMYIVPPLYNFLKNKITHKVLSHV